MAAWHLHLICFLHVWHAAQCNEHQGQCAVTEPVLASSHIMSCCMLSLQVATAMTSGCTSSICLIMAGAYLCCYVMVHNGAEPWPVLLGFEAACGPQVCLPPPQLSLLGLQGLLFCIQRLCPLDLLYILNMHSVAWDASRLYNISFTRLHCFDIDTLLAPCWPQGL